MTPQFPASRTAEEFASVIDGTITGDVADRYAGLVETVTLLRSHPQPTPRTEFVADLRSRLLTAADDLLPARDSNVVALEPQRRSRRERHLGAAVAAVVLVGSTAGVAAASQGALPGDTLYPVKRGLEQAQVGLNANDAAKGKDMLGQAGTRLDELEQMLQGSNSASVDQIKATLLAFTNSAGSGSDLLFSNYQANGTDSDIARVRDFTSAHMALLQRLSELAPPTTAASFDRAAATLAGIDQQARVLCAGCSDNAAVGLPDSLTSLSSSKSLYSLIVLPSVQAQRAAAHQAALESQAKAAEAAAASLPPSSTDAKQSSPGTTTPSAPATSPLPTGLPAGQQPVRGLVEGLTKDSPLAPVTDPLKATLDGLTGTLSSDLGNTLGDTVDNTLGGLTGLLPKTSK